MTEPSSPIIDFYPGDFQLDLNGKKQDWEAIVKIPFIDEKRLLDAMKSIVLSLSQLTNIRQRTDVDSGRTWKKFLGRRFTIHIQPKPRRSV